MSADQTTYLFVDDLAKSVPELANLLKEASNPKTGKWDAQRFADALQTTNWWKQNSDTAKRMIQLSKVDPSQYKQEVTAAQSHVRDMAGQLGIKMTDAQIASQATADLYQGLDDAALRQQIGTLYTGPQTGPNAAGGTAVTLNGQIQQLVASYGVPVTQTWINNAVKQALTSGTGIEGATESLKQMAISTYPGLANQLNAGMTTHDIAQPYIASMAQTLEIPDTEIQLNDPTIQRALQGTTPGTKAPTPGSPSSIPGVTGIPGVPSGGLAGPSSGGGGGATRPVGSTGGATAAAVPQATTLFDFQKALRQDPRWDKTANAREQAYTMLHGLGQAFGFAS